MKLQLNYINLYMKELNLIVHGKCTKTTYIEGKHYG